MTIDVASITPPGRIAATKPSGTPMMMAKPMEASTSCIVGHMRFASSCDTGSRERNETPRSSTARFAAYFAKRT